MRVATEASENSQKSSFWTGIIAGLITAGAAIAGQYFINYKLIEKPKIDADAQTRLSQLTPILSTSCSASPKDAWTWRVVCETKNAGTYQAFVSIPHVALAANPDNLARKLYWENGSDFFKIAYEDDRHSYLANPTSIGDLTFYIVLDKRYYPNGINNNDLDAEVKIQYQTPSEVANRIESSYPDLPESDGVTLLIEPEAEVYLPQWTLRVAPVLTAAPPAAASSASPAQASDANQPGS